MISNANTIYHIQYDYDLNGATITLPANCVLDFNGGVFKNGKINLNGAIVQQGTDEFLDVETAGNFGNTLLDVKSDYAESHINSMTKGSQVNLYCDVNLINTLALRCNINGFDKPKIVMPSKRQAVNVLNADVKIVGVVVKNTRKEINTVNFPICIYSQYATNFTLDYCDVIDGAIYIDNTLDIRIENVNITNCHIDIDFSHVKQDTYTQHDALSFYGVQGLNIDNNKIKCKDVNRLVKISKDTGKPISSNTISKNIKFRNNDVIVDSINGKQLFDLYIGTKNIDVDFNRFDIKGHNMLVENKTGIDTDINEIDQSFFTNNIVNHDFCLFLWQLKPSSTWTVRKNQINLNSSKKTTIRIEQDVNMTFTRNNDIFAEGLNLVINDNSFNVVSDIDLELNFIKLKNVSNCIVDNT